jgi:hypothetical protein
MLEVSQEEIIKYKIRKDLKFYLFSSHTPCN